MDYLRDVDEKNLEFSQKTGNYFLLSAMNGSLDHITMAFIINVRALFIFRFSSLPKSFIVALKSE